jgi:hypothetical protein
MENTDRQAISDAFAIEWLDGEALLRPPPSVALVPDTWNWLENASGRYDHGAGAIFDPEGGVFACGGYAAGGYEEGAAWVGRFSAAGTLRWFRTFDQANAWDQARAIAQANDGGVFVAGNTQVAPGRPERHEGWLMRLDSDGHALWSKRLGGEPRQMHYFDDVVALDDGGAVALGINRRNMLYGNAWLVRFGADGTVIWEREIPGDTLPDLLNINAHSLRLGRNGLLYFIVGGTNACWLHAFGLDGRMVWRYRFDLPDYNFSCTGLDCDAEGVTVAGPAYARGLQTFSWVSRFDVAGRLLWTRTYNKGSSDIHAVSAVACLDGQRTLLAGTTGADYLGYHAWLEILDRNGVVEVHRPLDIGYENRLVSLRVSPDGRLCGAGRCQPLLESLPRIWLHCSTVDGVQP